MKRKLKGFTLVELVVTIAIVIILSVVSVPIYQGYNRNAKLSEGYALLGAILSAQKAYYSQYGMFLDRSHGSAGSYWVTCNEEVLRIDARGNKYFTLMDVGANDIQFNGQMLYFRARVFIPNSLVKNGTCLRLSYNLTTGPIISEGN